MTKIKLPQDQRTRVATDQVENSAGGYVWQLDPWQRLERFLILGVDGGTYYASERQLTLESLTAIEQALGQDGPRLVQETVRVSGKGLARSNSAALFTLAVACSQRADLQTRQLAAKALPDVARTFSHLAEFCQYSSQLRGWGRLLRAGVAAWFENRNPSALAFQVVKYRNRSGFTPGDVIRLSHPAPHNEVHSAVMRWTLGKLSPQGLADFQDGSGALELLSAYEQAKTCNVKELLPLIEKFRLSWEMIPSQHLKNPAVWQALLPALPSNALLRNLGRMSAIDALPPGSEAERLVRKRLADTSFIRFLHPLAILDAMAVYSQGHGVKSMQRKNPLAWIPSNRVIDALDNAFYLSFKNVTPCGKRVMLALDVSGSMWARLHNSLLSCRVASAAMAMVTARVEPDHQIMAFSHRLVPLTISPRQRLDDVVTAMKNTSYGATDCALPMLYASEKRIPVDLFVIYTDDETWYGKVHPCKALQLYRRKMGIPARLVTVGMASNGFTIADPNDGGMMDVVGFDPTTPQAISLFASLE